jgi:hypothetical protein
MWKREKEKSLEKREKIIKKIYKLEKK